MSGLVETATYILSRAEKRVEASAHNMANVSSPGYKRRVEFSEVMAGQLRAAGPDSSSATDFTAGKPVNTGSKFDLSIAGDGFFAVRGPEQLLYTRQGQFRRDPEGRLVTSQGYALQAKGGGDLVLKGSEFEVAADGMVTEAGEPVARVAIVDFENRATMVRGESGLFAAAEADAADVAAPSVRQGVLEASNVSTGDEMVAIMEALRRAEAGQRVINVYDDLMGRALSAFGQN